MFLCQNTEEMSDLRDTEDTTRKKKIVTDGRVKIEIDLNCSWPTLDSYR